MIWHILPPTGRKASHRLRGLLRGAERTSLFISTLDPLCVPLHASGNEPAGPSAERQPPFRDHVPARIAMSPCNDGGYGDMISAKGSSATTP